MNVGIQETWSNSADDTEMGGICTVIGDNLRVSNVVTVWNTGPRLMGRNEVMKINVNCLKKCTWDF